MIRRSTVLLAILASFAGAAHPQADDLLTEGRAAIPRLPGVAALPYTEIVPAGEGGVYRLTLERDLVTARAFQTIPGGGKPWQVAIRLTDPSAFALQPAMREIVTPVLGGIAPSEVILVSSGVKTIAAVASFPTELQNALAGFANLKGQVNLADGITAFVAVRLDPQGLVGRVQALLGSNGPVRLGAQIDPGSLQMTLRAAGYESGTLLSYPTPTAFAVSVFMPESTPFPFGAIGDPELVHVVHSTTELNVEISTVMKDGKPADTYTLTGAQRAKLWILGREFDGENTLKGTHKDGRLEIQRTGTIRIGWTDAFGLEGIGIESVTLDAKVGRIEIGATSRERSDANADLHPFDPAWKPESPKVSLGLGAVLAIGEGRTVSSKLGVGIANGKASELSLALDFGSEGVGLRDVPGFQGLGGEDHFVLNDVSIGFARATKSAFLGGKATWVDRGLAGRCAILRAKNDKGKTVRLVLLQCEGLQLDALVENLPDGAGLSLGSALVILSSESLGGITGAALGGPAADMVKKVTGDLARPVTFGQGITLMTRLDPMALPEHAREALIRTGVTEPVVLAGGLGGLRSKAPHIELYADLPRLPVPEGMPAWLNLAPRDKRGEVQDVGARLFLQAGIVDGSAMMRLGLEGLVGVRFGQSDLVLVGQMFVQVAAAGTGVRFGGRMDGEWNEPLGLAGIAFRDIVFGFGYDASQAVDVAFHGGIRIGSFDSSFSGILGLQAAPTVVLPKKLGLSFEASELSQLTHIQLMSGLLKGLVAGPMADMIPPGDMRALVQRVEKVDLIDTIEQVVPLPYVKYQDVKVYVATPGATFPGLDMEGIGVGLRGRMRFMNRDLGFVDDFLTVTNGLQIHGNPGDVDLGLLRLTNTDLLVRVPLPGVPALQEERAEFRLTGEAGAGCSFLDGELKIAIDRSAARFHQELLLAGYHADIHATADLSRWPACMLDGRFDKDLALDTLEAVRAAVQKKADDGLAKTKERIANTKQQVAGARDVVEKARKEAKAQRRKAAQEKLVELEQYCSRQSKQANTKVGEKAWAGAAAIAGSMKLEEDGSISKVDALRKELNGVRNVLEKLPGAAAKEGREHVEAVKQELDGAIAVGKTTVESVEDDLGVTDARKELQEAETALKNVRQDLMREHVDPVAAYATQLIESVSIEECGFDGGLDTLCSGKLPRFNVRGSFAGRTFDLQEALDLAPRAELVKRNRANLDRVAESLFALVDREKAGAFVDGLARE